MELDKETLEIAARIKLLVVDCDGVLTDGRLYYGEYGEELKVFHVHDGQGIVSLRKAGIHTAIVTARSSKMLTARAAELGIRLLVQNAKDKASVLNEICEKEQIDPMDVAYVGDDLADICAMEIVGLPVSVADGVPETKAAAVLVTSKNGGHGAVREVADMLLSTRA